MFKKINKLDILAISGILSFTLIYALRYLNFSIHPFEDAAILMRYAKNIADGYGIVWNKGEHPVDGGTDFLFMLFVAALHKIGISIEFAVRFISALSHLATVCMLYLIHRKYYRVGVLFSIIPALFFALGPGMQYVAAYFGTPFFSFIVVITCYLGIKICLDDYNPKSNFILFSFSCLFLGLARPEGAILAFLIFCSIIYAKKNVRVRQFIFFFGCIFIGIGGLYFIWHWLYFGYPLPNPFYKKGGGNLHWVSLRFSLFNLFQLSFPFVIPFIVIATELFNRALYISRRYSQRVRAARFSNIENYYLIPIIGFALIWVLLSNEMNYLMRFQYPLLCMVLVFWYPITKVVLKKMFGEEFDRLKIIDSILVRVGLFAGIITVVLYQHIEYPRNHDYDRDGRFSVAMILSDYKQYNYKLACTEAGLLPLYSDWFSIDTWGLNDQWIAHHGRVTEEYLNTFKPEVIMFYAFFSPIVQFKGSGEFFEVTKVLKTFAEKNNYVLVGSFGISTLETHYYYVKRNFMHSAEISNKIRTMDYIWFKTGDVCNNYAPVQ